MQRIADEGEGVVVLLRKHEDNSDLLRRIRSFQLADEHVKEQSDDRHATELRTFGVGAQIISDLGIRKMRVLSAPKIMHGLSGFGLEVVDYVS